MVDIRGRDRRGVDRQHGAGIYVPRQNPPDHGDLTRKVTAEVRGELLELKNTLNTMVDRLSTFSTEVTRVARQVGVEGELGGQAEVIGVSGTWRDLTESVNLMASNLTDQVRGSVTDGYLIIEVEDTGIGIPQQQLPRIFDDFYQVDSSSTRRAGGTGLGLAICKKLCQLMGGEITATSTPGIGSLFTIRLPIVEIPADADDAHQPPVLYAGT